MSEMEEQRTTSLDKRVQNMQIASRLVRVALGNMKTGKHEAGLIASLRANDILLGSTTESQPSPNEVDCQDWQKYLVELDALRPTEMSSVVMTKAIKDAVLDAVLLPLLYPRAYRNGAKPKRALLLSGPNGTGKTKLVKAVTAKINETVPLKLLSVQASGIMSKWTGDSEKKVDGLFDFAEANAPIILFIDEVDGFFGKKKDAESDGSTRTKNTFLQRLSGITDLAYGVILIAATNKPFLLDTSFHSRFDQEFMIPLPTRKQRTDLLTLGLRTMIHKLSVKDIVTIADVTEGYSGRDLDHLLTQAQDLQYKELEAVQDYVTTFCDPASGTSLHEPRCPYFGSLLPCRVSPARQGDGNARKLDWKDICDIAVPNPLSRARMMKAVSLCHRTTTDVDMIELETYYDEKMIHRYRDDTEDVDNEIQCNCFPISCFRRNRFSHQ